MGFLELLTYNHFFIASGIVVFICMMDIVCTVIGYAMPPFYVASKAFTIKPLRMLGLGVGFSLSVIGSAYLAAAGAELTGWTLAMVFISPAAFCFVGFIRLLVSRKRLAVVVS